MDEHVIRTYVRAEPRFTHGSGAELVTENGDVYLDMLGGIAVNALGHAHPRLTRELQEQVGQLLHVSNLFRHEYTETVAAKLAQLSGLDAVFFTNSGTEANEAALKLVRKFHRTRGWTPRTDFVALEGGFHGRSFGAISMTAHAPYREPFAPVVPGGTFIPPGDIAELERTIEQNPAALILEPIQGEGGVVELGADYLRAARAACDRSGTLLIHDEVQCGTGRTGRFLAAQHAGVTPDIVTLAKPLAAGLPMGAMIVRKELAETLVPGDHGSTFAGGPLACRAAAVVLDELEHGLLDTVADRGASLRAGLEDIAADFDVVREVRGRGLMLGLQLENAQELQRALFERRVITNCTAGEVLRLLPPYVVTPEQIERALDEIRACLAAL